MHWRNESIILVVGKEAFLQLYFNFLQLKQEKKMWRVWRLLITYYWVYDTVRNPLNFAIKVRTKGDILDAIQKLKISYVYHIIPD